MRDDAVDWWAMVNWGKEIIDGAVKETPQAVEKDRDKKEDDSIENSRSSSRLNEENKTITEKK